MLILEPEVYKILAADKKGYPACQQLEVKKGDLLPRAGNGRLRHKERLSAAPSRSTHRILPMGNPDQPGRAAP